MARPSLPPAPPNPELQARHSQIEARRSLRPYDYSNPDGVAAIGGIALEAGMPVLPVEDRPSERYMGVLGLTYLRMSAHFLSLQPIARFCRPADLAAAASVPTPVQPAALLGSRTETINLMSGATPRVRPASLEVYAALTEGLEPLALLERLRRSPGDRDALFAYQRIAGPNPYILQQVRGALPDHFPVTEEHFQRAMGTLRPLGAGGDTLDRARQENRLFLVDCAALDGVVSEKYLDRQKYLTAAMGLFVRPLDASAALLPVAIQCGQNPGPATPIFTPADAWRWRIAQAFLSSAEGSLHEAGEHLALTHLVIEAFAMSARRNLAPTHPVALLLEPHFEGTHLINYTARHNLIAEDGVLDRMMAPDIKETGKVARTVLQSFNLHAGDPRSRLEERGLLDPSGLTTSPFREDALPLWDALHAWVVDYLAVYYPDDAAVAGDVELQAFVDELSAAGRLKGVPAVRTRPAAADLLAHAIFTGSVHHAAVNFPQYPFMGYVPNMPGALYAPPPTWETPNTEQSLIDALPPLDVAVLQMYTVWQLSAVRANKLGEYPNLKAPEVADPRVDAALKKLGARLAQIEREILAREPGRPLPYRYLLPSTLPASIII